MPSPDDALLERAVAGDGEALATLLEQHGPQVRRSLEGKIPPRWQAVLSVDDVMQETYIDAFLDVGRFDPRSPEAFTAWLLTIARRNLVDALRMLDAEKRGRNRRQAQPRPMQASLTLLYERIAGSRSTPSQHAAREEVVAALRRAVSDLPPAYRTVIELYDLDCRPVDDVAGLLQRSAGAVFMLRARAHRFLAQMLGTRSQYM